MREGAGGISRSLGDRAMLSEEEVQLYFAGPRVWYSYAFGPANVIRDCLVIGDSQSAVSDDTVTELVALAKANKREDFDFLAGACGVAPERRDALWTGTRARVKA